MYHLEIRVVDEAVALIERPELADRQRAALRAVTEQFRGTHAAEGAASAIAQVAGLEASK